MRFWYKWWCCVVIATLRVKLWLRCAQTDTEGFAEIHFHLRRQALVGSRCNFAQFRRESQTSLRHGDVLAEETGCARLLDR